MWTAVQAIDTAVVRDAPIIPATGFPIFSSAFVPGPDGDELFGTDIEEVLLEGRSDANLAMTVHLEFEGGVMTVTGTSTTNNLNRNDNTVTLSSSIIALLAVLYDIDEVDDGTAGQIQNQIIELEQRELW